MPPFPRTPRRNPGPLPARIPVHEKIVRFPSHSQDHPMDAEQINQIGATLADLSARTVDLRRYL